MQVHLPVVLPQYESGYTLLRKYVEVTAVRCGLHCAHKATSARHFKLLRIQGHVFSYSDTRPTERDSHITRNPSPGIILSVTFSISDRVGR
jgi:hypothetical protein